MDCPYCDTDKLAHSNLVPCVLEKCEGYEGDLELKNPLDLNDIMPYINYRLQQPHHSISITGGEPLLYPNIEDLIIRFKAIQGIEKNSIDYKWHIII